MKKLSILLPTYNCDCTQLVQELHKQCEDIEGLDYEIIVADDGSNELSLLKHNLNINTLSNTRYIIRHINSGRAAIRNFLASQAKYEWLLFIDGDLTLIFPNFIKNYLNAVGNVIVGGIAIEGYHPENLRWKYEKSCEKAHSAENRKKKGNKDFRTTNFMIRKDIFENIKFDEDFHYYGYEDVLFGKILKEKNISIEHIENPISLNRFENNQLFLKKTKESLYTLYIFRKKLAGYSHILTIAEKLNYMHLIPIINIGYNLMKKKLINKIIDNKPSIYAFNIYKVLYYIHLTYQKGNI